MSALREQCRGKWRSILTLLGVDARYLSGRHSPCPMCEGTDRFRFDDKEGSGSWICGANCKAGDGFSLLMKLKGWDFKTCASEVEAIVGKAERGETRQKRDEKELRSAMNRLWTASRPVCAADPVGLYLAARGISLDAFPTALRYAERLYYDKAVYFPGMLAKVTAPDGSPCTIHRTYLDGHGGKAAVEDARRIMPCKMPKGCAVRLAKPGPVLGIAEGIETALAASLLFDVPCWAAINANMLMAWEPPAEVQEVIVFGDNDKKFKGHAATYVLANRLAEAKKLPVTPKVTDTPGTDWNNVLLDRLAGARAA